MTNLSLTVMHVLQQGQQTYFKKTYFLVGPLALEAIFFQTTTQTVLLSVIVFINLTYCKNDEFML